jgi:hypothetical protein
MDREKTGRFCREQLDLAAAAALINCLPRKTRQTTNRPNDLNAEDPHAVAGVSMYGIA